MSHIILILTLFAGVHSKNMKEDIFIAGFLPVEYLGEENETTTIYEAVNFALENINNSSHILKNYNLKILWNDTQVCSL